jgi:transposase
MAQTIFGCDLSRSFIDTHALPSGTAVRLENTGPEVARWVACLAPDCLVVFEATSGCDGPIIAALAARAIPYARVNPRQAREFARATGVLAKTDRVDARVLAEMGQRLELEVTVPPDPDRVRLADLIRRRKQLVEMRKAEKVRRHSAGQPEVLKEIEAMIVLLDRRVARLDAAIAALIDKSPVLAAQARLLRPVPGIGPTVLAILLGELPELGTLDRRKIASLAGLAPHARESGTWRGTRRIWGGRRKVREALYIAALSASRSVPALKALRQRMRDAGKAPKTILIAVGRQLLVILNAMIRTGQPIRL